VIEFKDVKIGYSDPIVEISIESLEKGMMYALIGSNGSGKSTFLKSICGQQKLVNGTILINGKQIVEMNRRELANTVAFVPSKFPETDFMSVIDFISLGRTPYVNTIGRLSEADNKIVEWVLDEVQIKHLVSKKTTQLSDGERQLCAVARALAQKTPIILLDEPTGFLDYRNKHRLLELLSKLTKELKIIVLFSTHDLESIRHFDIELIGITTEFSQKKMEKINSLLPFEEMIVRYYK
jgi:iron complex transport system ATP-binding protein